MARDELILADLIANRAEKMPDFDVLTFVSIGKNGELQDEVRTYQQLWDNGQRIANALLQTGLKKGDAFALVMLNEPEFVEAMIASSIIGTIFVPIDPRTKGEKLKYMLEYAECRGGIIGSYALKNFSDIVANLENFNWILYTGEEANETLCIQSDNLIVDSLSNRLDSEIPTIVTVVTDPNATMQMLYTSGTTGDPKAIASPYIRFGSISQLGSVIGLKEGDRPYTGLSLTHANAQLLTLANALYMGLRAVISRKFTKSRLWEIIRKYNCTTFNLLGGMTTAIYSEPEKNDDKINPVRYVLSAGMPLAIWEAFAARFDLDIYEFYGTAEGGLTLNPPGAGPVGSIGKAPATMIAKVFDENDKEVAAGQQGELVFRNADGSCPVVEYYKNPQASRKKMAGGWMRTGDIVHTDQEGWFHYDYRKGGGIRHNGDFVNPGYIEKVLAEHQDIDDVFVYGVEAESGAPGEKDIVAAIVPVQSKTLDPSDIFQFCRTRLEANFVPGYLHVMEEIPKTASEKPQERFCIEDFQRMSAQNRIFENTKY